nr:LPD28 domain-containing protein [uncultured Agathobaculum sp.]
MSRHDANRLTYNELTIFDRPALFTECRVDRATVPEGVYRYELRHGDEDWGEPIELSRSLMVNFYGTVLTREPFQLPIDGWILLESGSLSFQDGGCRTLAAFQEKYPESEKDVIDFYSLNEPNLHDLCFTRSEAQDRAAGCIGHLRGDFGSGKQFYTTWWPHQNDALNTLEFKADIDRTVNWLREQPDSPFRDLDTMKRCCDRYERSCTIKQAALPSCGFMVKTKQYVYMLRCTPVKGDYQFYIYCYQRKPFEKARKEQQKNDRLAVKKRAEPER